MIGKICFRLGIIFSLINVFWACTPQSKLAANKDWAPELYEENSSIQNVWQNRFFKYVQLKGNEHILDLGCGNGRFPAKLANLASKGTVHGLDLSKQMIQSAKNKYGNKIPNLSFSTGAMERISFDDQFDYVVSFSSIHFVKDQKSLIENVSKALKKGGKTYFRFGAIYGDAVLAIAQYVGRKEKWKNLLGEDPFSLYGYHQDYYEKLYKKSGLRLTRIDRIASDDVIEGKDAFFKWMLGWFQVPKHFSQAQKEEFIKDVVEAYLQLCPIENGKVHIYDHQWEIEAVKL